MLTLKLAEWQTLVEQLKQKKSVEERLQLLEVSYPGSSPSSEANPLYKLVIKSLAVLDQDPLLAGEPFLKSFAIVEEFYQEIGGLIGYYVKVLELYLEKNGEECVFTKPSGVDLVKIDTRPLVRVAIESLEKMGGLFAVGGAGDRLDFKDEETGASQSVATYPFLGRTLLEGLLRDVRGLEFFGEKLLGRKISIPLMFMTSAEKNNHEHVVSCLIQNRFFGKKEKDFLIASQPLVPLIDEEGHFVLKDSQHLLLKPGGHGAIWKVAMQHKVFDWFEKRGVSHLFLRQINNPIAGVDFGWLCFLGEGISSKKSFGFAVCQRRVKVNEGMIALIAKKGRQWIGNIEYTDFKKRGVADEPESPSSPYSKFPANTNILFADLSRVKRAASLNPHPGLLLNPKHEVRKGVMGARLESTMQHMADEFTDPVGVESLSTFVTFNERFKTISSIKKAFAGSAVETPVGALYDTLKCAYELFTAHLRFEMPSFPEEESFDGAQVPFLIAYHPALGPLYSVIAQKIEGGSLAEGSELLLEIAELEVRGLTLSGSMAIEAPSLLGKCFLKNVVVKNRGIDPSHSHDFSRGEVKRRESFHLHIEGKGEFIAEDVVFEGDFSIKVETNTCVRAAMRGLEVVLTIEPLCIPPWTYTFDDEDSVVLSKAPL